MSEGATARAGVGGAGLLGERYRGYAEVAAATLINGSIGVMVSYATMPTGMLLTLRMAIAGAILAVPFVLLGRWRELAQPGVRLRLPAVGLIVAANLILYFLSIRYSGVAIAVFLSYMAPVYLAIAAPIFLKERTEAAVWGAIALAMVGMAAIVLPGALIGGATFSVVGITTGIAAGICYAAALMTIKSVRRKVAGSTIVLAQCVCTTLAILPLGLIEVMRAELPVFTARNLLMALLLGALTTAFTFTLFTHGIKYVKVQHASIIGYLEPLSAPIYALLLLGQVPSLWTVAGGLLIVIAGVLLVRFGRAPRPEPEELHA